MEVGRNKRRGGGVGGWEAKVKEVWVEIGGGGGSGM